MKRFAFILLLLAGPAWAQPPLEEVNAPTEQTIELAPGQTRYFKFNEPVKKMMIPTENVVEVIPQPDQTFSFQGINPGETDVTARSEDGKVLRRLRVVVTGGHLVKIYRPDVKDFIGFTCSGTGCGRADPDLPNGGRPTSTSITNTRRTRDGAIISTTDGYQ